MITGHHGKYIGRNKCETNIEQIIKTNSKRISIYIVLQEKHKKNIEQIRETIL